MGIHDELLAKLALELLNASLIEKPLRDNTISKLHVYSIPPIEGGDSRGRYLLQTFCATKSRGVTHRRREEMQCHANTSAQIQSVLSAERQQHQQDLKISRTLATIT